MSDARDDGRGPSLRVVPGGTDPSPRASPERVEGSARADSLSARPELVEGRAAGVDEDTALVGAFLLGNDAAFGALVRRHEDLVLRIVRRYAASPDDARDLSQRTFLRAFEAARRAFGRTGERFPVRRWLVRIAVNLSKNHVRDAQRWTRAPATVLRDAAADAPLAADALERAEKAARVRREVLRLPPRQREVLTLRVDAELPFAEIAEALGITENAAKVSFHHAARRLREALEENAP